MGSRLNVDTSKHCSHQRMEKSEHGADGRHINPFSDKKCADNNARDKKCADNSASDKKCAINSASDKSVV